MATILLNHTIDLSIVYPELVFILTNIKETQGYDVNGNPTGVIVGYALTLVDLVDFKKIKVKIPLISLPIEINELKEKKASGARVFIQLHNAFVKPYFNGKTKSIEDSISASNFVVIEEKF